MAVVLLSHIMLQYVHNRINISFSFCLPYNGVRRFRQTDLSTTKEYSNFFAGKKGTSRSRKPNVVLTGLTQKRAHTLYNTSYTHLDKHCCRRTTTNTEPNIHSKKKKLFYYDYRFSVFFFTFNSICIWEFDQLPNKMDTDWSEHTHTHTHTVTNGRQVLKTNIHTYIYRDIHAPQCHYRV